MIIFKYILPIHIIVYNEGVCLWEESINSGRVTLTGTSSVSNSFSKLKEAELKLKKIVQEKLSYAVVQNNKEGVVRYSLIIIQLIISLIILLIMSLALSDMRVIPGCHGAGPGRCINYNTFGTVNILMM